MRKFPLLFVVIVSACAPAAPPAPTTVPANGARCDAAKIQALVGEDGSPELGERARVQSGAKTLRWLAPGDIVTQEFRADRLNIDLDDAGRIKALRCS